MNLLGISSHYFLMQSHHAQMAMPSLDTGSISLQVAARKPNIIIGFTCLRRCLARVFLTPVINTKSYTLLSTIKRPSICRSRTCKLDAEPPVFNRMDEEKRRWHKRAEEIKRLQFPSVFLAGLREEYEERHIRDVFSLDSFDSEDEVSDKREQELQYTDAFKEGNVITRVFFEGEKLNPVCLSNIKRNLRGMRV
jgi:hypothetical protein